MRPGCQPCVDPTNQINESRYLTWLFQRLPLAKSTDD